jgi:hypothetical protein
MDKTMEDKTMNRRKFVKLLAALPFAGALWRNLAGEVEAGVITADDIVDVRPPLFVMGTGDKAPAAEIAYQDITLDIEGGEVVSEAAEW